LKSDGGEPDVRRRHEPGQIRRTSKDNWSPNSTTVKNIITVILALANRRWLGRRIISLDDQTLRLGEKSRVAGAEKLRRRQNGRSGAPGARALFLQEQPAADVSGHQSTLPPKVAMSFGMILDELATNAVKFGALSNSSGHVFDWSSMEGPDERASTLTLRWREDGGPRVADPKKRGIGLTLIDCEVSYGLSGSAAYDFGETGFFGNVHKTLETEAGIAGRPWRVQR
jgi:hypothetical protein